MRKLERLIREAKDACEWRGHNMERFNRRSKDVATSQCKTCGAWATVMTSPLPNDIEIGGSAVAINCGG